MTKKISNRFRAIVRVTRICADICGVNVFDHDYRINWRTVIVFLILNISVLCMSYTAYVGFVIEGDWKIVLQVLSIGGGTLVQGYCKFVNSVRQQTNFRFLLDELYEIYEEYELLHSDYQLYLNKSLQFLSKLMKLCAFVVMLMVLGMAVVTLFFSIFFNSRHLIVQCEVPGLDPTTEKGFFLTLVIQVSFVGIGGFGFYAGDMAFFTPISQVKLLKDIVRCKFHDLNEIIRDQPDNKKASTIALRNIIEFHQRYLRFLRVTQDTYFWVILIQIGTLGMAIVCTLFSILLGTWPGGYVYMIYCFVMLYAYCGIGTMIEISNDWLIYSCYNDVLWYNLTVQQKKMLRIMLMMTQNTAGLTVGSLVPLSMNTGLNVTKMIYSIAMMLFNFAD